MPQLRNLQGQKFGKLTVLEKAPNKHGHVYWICQCDCGSPKKTIASTSLLSGKIQSCGCYQKQIRHEKSNKPILDLTGQLFGKLIALKPLEQRNANGCVIWQCKCDCGNIKNVPSNLLIQNKVSSCGCLCSKGEEKIKKLLLNAQIPFEQQKTFDTCYFKDTGAKARFDFYVNNQYLIEFDGVQHFSAKSTWEKTQESFENIRMHDIIKNNWAHENHIPLIRIPYTQLEDIDLVDLILETSQYII